MIVKWPLWVIAAFCAILVVMVLIACLSNLADSLFGYCIFGVSHPQCMVDYLQLSRAYLLDALAMPFLLMGLTWLVIWMFTQNLEWYFASAAAVGLAFYLLGLAFITRMPVV